MILSASVNKAWGQIPITMVYTLANAEDGSLSSCNYFFEKHCLQLSPVQMRIGMCRRDLRAVYYYWDI
jgi:hypothetical protein